MKSSIEIKGDNADILVALMKGENKQKDDIGTEVLFFAEGCIVINTKKETVSLHGEQDLKKDTRENDSLLRCTTKNVLNI